VRSLEVAFLTASWEGSATYYRSCFAQAGLLSAHRPVNETQLVAWASFLAGRDPERLGLTGTDLDWWWLPLMLRPRANAQTPAFKHVLLRALLDCSEVTRVGLLDYVPSGPGAADVRAKDRQFADSLRELTGMHARAGTTVSVAGALRVIGAWESFRHARKQFPALRREVLNLRRSSASVRRFSPRRTP
jgi:hypothetical protein